MHLYDCFTFYDEIELLELRLNELDSKVDFFVILEGDRTYQNKEKESIFLKNKDLFSKFENKIIHLSYPSESYTENVWENEAGQMNYISHLYDRIQDNDIIMLSNLDEIPRKEILSKENLNFLLKQNKKIVLEMIMFYWYYNTVFIWDKIISKQGYKLSMNGLGWFGTRVGYKKDLEKEIPYKWFKDMSEENLYLSNAGWHFSFIGKGDNAVAKLNSNAHKEYKDIKENTFDKRRNLLLDPVGRDNLIRFYDSYPTELLPSYIKNNLDKFKHNIINQI